jgi:glutamyl-tRNA synthetase
LQVRLAGGVFILRIEDLDQSRVRREYYGLIVEQLLALGIDWDIGPPDGHTEVRRAEVTDEAYTQSLRVHRYANAMQSLREQHVVYPCYCSRKDIQQALSAPHGASPNVYPGTCRPDPRQSNMSKHETISTRVPSWRMQVENKVVSFEDVLQGHYTQHLLTECGDFVIQRADSAYAYHLACAVDDGLMGITDIVRGADLLDSTPRQIYLLRALGFGEPRYWHVPLLNDAHGERMAKRNRSTAPNLGTKQQIAMIVGEFAYSVGLCNKMRSISCLDLLNELTPESFLKNLRGRFYGGGQVY